MKDENKIWSEYWSEKESCLWILKFTPTYKKIVKMFKTINLPKDAKILDAGCGTGKLASFWLNEGYDILGVDISDVALAITNKKGVKTMKADIMKGLPFEDKSFDLVYSDGLLEHFVDPEPILTELFRVSKKYVLTFVPRISMLKTVVDTFVPPPKEYKKKDSEWIELHEIFKPINIKSERLFTVLGILCKKKFL
ncbi:MAG: class I SAM-dependent methyltransferase [Halobacteriota archaeon]